MFIFSKLRLKIRLRRLERVYNKCYKDMKSHTDKDISGDLCNGLNTKVCQLCPHYFARRRSINEV